VVVGLFFNGPNAAASTAPTLIRQHWQPPKRERDRQAHLNYYSSAYNRGRHCNYHTSRL